MIWKPPKGHDRVRPPPSATWEASSTSPDFSFRRGREDPGQMEASQARKMELGGTTIALVGRYLRRAHDHHPKHTKGRGGRALIGFSRRLCRQPWQRTRLSVGRRDAVQSAQRYHPRSGLAVAADLYSVIKRADHPGLLRQSDPGSLSEPELPADLAGVR